MAKWTKQQRASFAETMKRKKLLALNGTPPAKDGLPKGVDNWLELSRPNSTSNLLRAMADFLEAK